ncbi:MAG: tRNA (guanosine(37)-N1)-methyltransferase TrmD, partial [Bacteroidota bacterium]
MRIDVITVLPALFDGPFSDSILKRAQEKGLVEIHVHNLRDYSTDKHKNVDDYQYGGGAGMVLRIEPIAACINQLKSEREYDEIVYMTPDGKVLEQTTSNQMSTLKNIMVLCGHYKGVDERVRNLYITREISIGSYVLSGGELAAAVLVDSIIRLVPGVLG